MNAHNIIQRNLIRLPFLFFAHLCPFSVLNVLTSLYLVDIQPNSKLHPPHQNFLNPLQVTII